MLEKQKIRDQMLAKLKTQTAAERDKKSESIRRQFLGSPEFREAAIICFYVSLPYEVDTKALIEEAFRLKKKVVVPKTCFKEKVLELYEIRDLEKDLKPGALDILEPDAAKLQKFEGRPDLVVVPGLAFDEQNFRIGYGAGFYDRFLEKQGIFSVKVGLCFAFQRLEELPVEAHDQPVDLIWTD